MINFGDSLYSILTGSTELTPYVDDKIYPLVAPENTALPFITYEYQGQNEYSKIGLVGSDISTDIFIFSDDLDQAKKIANAVNQVLNFYNGTVGNYTIVRALYANYDETYSDGAYLLKLTFSVKIR
jgi:hypothetical protein